MEFLKAKLESPHILMISPDPLAPKGAPGPRLFHLPLHDGVPPPDQLLGFAPVNRAKNPIHSFRDSPR